MFIEKIVSDFSSFIKGPKSFFESVLRIEEFHVSKPMLVFVFFMHCYFVFLPSYLTLFNILAIVILFLSLANIYYFSQEAYLRYCELSGFKRSDSDGFGRNFYRVAYVHALAGIPILILNLLNNVFSFVYSDNFLVAAFVATLMNLPIMLIAFYMAYKLSVVVNQGDEPIKNFFDFYLRALIKALEQGFGLFTIKEIKLDWQELS